MEGLRAVLELDPAQRDRAIELERKAEEDAERIGLLRVVNEGFWAAIAREHQIAVLLETRGDHAPDPNDLLQLKDQEGRRVGEWTGGTASGGGGSAGPAMGDFVLYEGGKIRGEPFFAIPEIEVPELDGVKGIQNVTSCSPSAQVDEALRRWAGMEHENVHSRIIGFDIDRDDLK